MRVCEASPSIRTVRLLPSLLHPPIHPLDMSAPLLNAAAPSRALSRPSRRTITVRTAAAAKTIPNNDTTKKKRLHPIGTTGSSRCLVRVRASAAVSAEGSAADGDDDRCANVVDVDLYDTTLRDGSQQVRFLFV